MNRPARHMRSLGALAKWASWCRRVRHSRPRSRRRRCRCRRRRGWVAAAPFFSPRKDLPSSATKEIAF